MLVMQGFLSVYIPSKILWSVRVYDNTELDGGSLPGRAHRANVVHQLLVLHETATTEVTGARVPLNGRLLWWENCFPSVSRSTFNKSSPSYEPPVWLPVEVEEQAA